MFSAAACFHILSAPLGGGGFRTKFKLSVGKCLGSKSLFYMFLIQFLKVFFNPNLKLRIMRNRQVQKMNLHGTFNMHQ